MCTFAQFPVQRTWPARKPRNEEVRVVIYLKREGALLTAQEEGTGEVLKGPHLGHPEGV